MKVLKVSSLLAIGAIAAVSAAMMATNPGRDAYEEYAVQQLNRQLDRRICRNAPLIFNDVCGSVLENNADFLRDVVADGTTRQNFIVLSVYKTELSTEAALQEILPPSLSLSADNLPVYEFESIGLFQRFYTYKAQGL